MTDTNRRPVVDDLEPHEAAHLLDTLEQGFWRAVEISIASRGTPERADRLAVARELHTLNADEWRASLYRGHRQPSESIPQMLTRTAKSWDCCQELEAGG